MSVKFGPAGLGPGKTALEVLEKYHSLGLRACEIAFTYSVYIKPEDAKIIGKKARELGIELSIHAPYFVNLASKEKEKREASIGRILKCCEIGELLGAKVVVFHPGYYINAGKTQQDRTDSYNTIKNSVGGIMSAIKQKKWHIRIAPETMGKVNVFGSIQEISRLVKDTGCSFCIDFAHILARDKKVNYSEVENLFSGKEWHVHFSGIIYGEKGEKSHKPTEKSEWKELLKNLPKDREIRIINESPNMLEDSVEGLKIYGKLD
jgi:deoxyribonuclease-4